MNLIDLQKKEERVVSLELAALSQGKEKRERVDKVVYYLPSGWFVTDSQVSLEPSRRIETSELHLAGTGTNAK